MLCFSKFYLCVSRSRKETGALDIVPDLVGAAVAE